MIVAVSDTGPLIHLAEIDAIHLLEVVDELIAPETVCYELEAGGAPAGFGELSTEEVISDRDSQWFDTELDDGEAAALAVATDRDAVFLTDDLAARELAKEAGIDVHGSVGIVALASGRGELSEDKAAGLMRSL